MPTKFQIDRKYKTLSALIEARQSILVRASTLSDEQQDQVFLGIWSVKDLLEAEAKDEQTHLQQITDYFMESK